MLKRPSSDASADSLLDVAGRVRVLSISAEARLRRRLRLRVGSMTTSVSAIKTNQKNCLTLANAAANDKEINTNGSGDKKGIPMPTSFLAGFGQETKELQQAEDFVLCDDPPMLRLRCKQQQLRETEELSPSGGDPQLRRLEQREKQENESEKQQQEQQSAPFVSSIETLCSFLKNQMVGADACKMGKEDLVELLLLRSKSDIHTTATSGSRSTSSSVSTLVPNTPLFYRPRTLSELKRRPSRLHLQNQQYSTNAGFGLPPPYPTVFFIAGDSATARSSTGSSSISSMWEPPPDKNSDNNNPQSLGSDIFQIHNKEAKRVYHNSEGENGDDHHDDDLSIHVYMNTDSFDDHGNGMEVTLSCHDSSETL